MSEMNASGSEVRANAATTGRKLARGSALRVINLIGTALVSLLIMPFVVRSLGDRLYGIWTLVATFIGYYGILDLGISGAVSRYIAGAIGAANEDESNLIFNTAIGLLCAIAGIILVIGITIALLSAVFCKSPADALLFRKIIFILTVSFALSFPIRGYIGALEAHLRFDTTAALSILALLLRTALVIGVLLLGYKVVGLAWAVFFSGLPSGFLYIYFSRRILPFLRLGRKFISRQTAKTLLSYGFSSAVLQIANTIRFDVDSLVIAACVSLVGVTHFRIAGALVQNFMGLMTAIIGVFSFVFSHQEGAKDFAAIKKTFFFATKISAGVSSFVAFGLIAWGKPFITRWMGTQYLDAYPCLVILVLGYVVALWQTPSVSLFYGISKHKLFAAFTCAEALANLVISIALAKKYGIFGVAFGTFLPMVLFKLIVQPIYTCYVASLSFGEYVRRMAKSLLVIGISLVIPVLLSIRFASPNYKVLVVLGIISAVCYGVPLAVFEFTSSERKLLRQAILPSPSNASLPHAYEDA